MSQQKDLEAKLAEAMKNAGFPKWHRYPLSSEYRYTIGKSSFDFAWPEFKVAIEVNGGQWSDKKMGHNSGKGVERDARKINYATLNDWILLIFVTDHIDKKMQQYTIPTIQAALLKRGVELLTNKDVINVFNEDAEELVNEV